MFTLLFFFSSRRRHTRWTGDWSSDVCSSDLASSPPPGRAAGSGSSFPWRKTGNDLEGRELRASISGLMGVAITRESAYEQQEEPCRRATIPHSVSAPVAVRDRLAGANLRGLPGMQSLEADEGQAGADLR